MDHTFYCGRTTVVLDEVHEAHASHLSLFVLLAVTALYLWNLLSEPPINTYIPKGLPFILVKKIFEKIFRFGQDLGSKFSHRELQNGHFGGNGLRGLTSLLERITEEGLSQGCKFTPSKLHLGEGEVKSENYNSIDYFQVSFN
jgi:hypothetical protein